jgi:hypothetical protein
MSFLLHCDKNAAMQQDRLPRLDDVDFRDEFPARQQRWYGL